MEAAIEQVKSRLRDPELAWLFENCFPNTLDTTVFHTPGPVPDTFVITGDIDAMWLRDSTAQVWPYLPLAPNDEPLRHMIEGLIRRQAHCVRLDPYANAFNNGPGDSQWHTDLTDMRPELHERKWEIDSLCYMIRLSHGYWKTTGDSSPFDSEWLEAIKVIIRTFREQQRKSDSGPYVFQRVSPVPTDTVPLGGRGNPTRKVGLIHSMFRPSDDSCVFPFLIPSNYFAAVSLGQAAEMVDALHPGAGAAGEARALKAEVEAALSCYSLALHSVHGQILAYEADGYENVLLMDDANIPSLLSLPYLGAMDDESPLYKSTRAFVLSEDNPYYFRGPEGEGVGGPHIGVPYAWPMAIIMRAMTSNEDEEISSCLEMLKATHAGTGFMHESFNVNDPSDFTRPWFAWVNTLFGELILKTLQERPHLLV